MWKNSVFNKSENEIDGKGMCIYIYICYIISPIKHVSPFSSSSGL